MFEYKTKTVASAIRGGVCVRGVVAGVRTPRAACSHIKDGVTAGRGMITGGTLPGGVSGVSGSARQEGGPPPGPGHPRP